MRKTMIAALGAAAMLLSAPAISQDFPVKGGDYWTVAEITIDDGHFGDYADHLAGLYRKSIDFQKSKGWIKASYILANVNKRAGDRRSAHHSGGRRRARERNQRLSPIKRTPVGQPEWRTRKVSQARRQHAAPRDGLPEVNSGCRAHEVRPARTFA